MAELKEIYPICHYLVGGHSQGGFLTYSLLMNFPETMAGAFPISGGVILQCDPDVYTDRGLTQRSANRATRNRPWQKRPNHGFSCRPICSGVSSARQTGRPSNSSRTMLQGICLRRLPVGQAIRWLESHASNNPQNLDPIRRKSTSSKSVSRCNCGAPALHTLNPN